MIRRRWAVLVLVLLTAPGCEPGHSLGLFRRPNAGYPACRNILFPSCFRIRAWCSNNRDYIYPRCYPERRPGCKEMKERDCDSPVEMLPPRPPSSPTVQPSQRMPPADEEPEKPREKESSPKQSSRRRTEVVSEWRAQPVEPEPRPEPQQPMPRSVSHWHWEQGPLPATADGRAAGLGLPTKTTRAPARY
jgi:hypothetical protein